MKILMVCLGNICRSPLAEGIMQDVIDKEGLDWEVDSAGTGSWHIRNPPDPRSRATAKKHGLSIDRQRARQFSKKDFDHFDLILAMDQSNYDDIIALASNTEEKSKVQKILDYTDLPNKDVPDPYWDDNGFEQVYSLLDNACREVVKEHALKTIKN